MQIFIQNREPLAREIWYYISSVGEVYAAQQLSAGRFFVEDLMGQSKHTNQRLTPKQGAFCLTFAGTAGLVTRGGMSRRWQQPIDYPSSAWIV